MAALSCTEILLFAPTMAADNTNMYYYGYKQYGFDIYDVNLIQESLECQLWAPFEKWQRWVISTYCL